MAREQVVVLGAGGEMPQYLEAMELAADIEGIEYDVLGILDDNTELHGKMISRNRVIGPLAMIHEMPDARLLWGLGNPRQQAIRLELAHRFRLATERFVTVVHPRAFVSRDARLDPGVTVGAGSNITAGAHLGVHVSVGFSCVVEHGSRLASGCLVASGVTVAGNCTVGAGSYLGQGANIRDHVSIGNLAMVGMGAVVVSDVLDGQTVIGIPAKVLRTVSIPQQFPDWLRAAAVE